MGHRGICICQNSARLAHSSICSYVYQKGKKMDFSNYWYLEFYFEMHQKQID